MMGNQTHTVPVTKSEHISNKVHSQTESYFSQELKLAYRRGLNLVRMCLAARPWLRANFELNRDLKVPMSANPKFELT